MSSAFENTVGRVGIPYFALPFCTIATCTFFSIKPESTTTLVSDDSTFENNDFEIEDFNNQTEIVVDWCKFGQGVLLSMGQVYAINDFRTSTIMNIAVFLASPLLFITSTIGALFGSLAGELQTSQCGNLIIFLPLRFYVKSILAHFRRLQTALVTILEDLIFNYWKSFVLANVKDFQNFRAGKMIKTAVTDLLKSSAKVDFTHFT